MRDDIPTTVNRDDNGVSFQQDRWYTVAVPDHP